MLSVEARERLQDYPWPGNVRQLENAMDAAALVALGATVEVTHLPLVVRENAKPRETPKDLRAEREALERRRVEEALTASGGNQTEAAKRLGMARRTLVNWIEQWDLPRPRKRG
jgi:DNA-binding NtrC family response regulator